MKIKELKNYIKPTIKISIYTYARNEPIARSPFIDIYKGKLDLERIPENILELEIKAINPASKKVMDIMV